jgi:hypothetical protein
LRQQGSAILFFIAEAGINGRPFGAFLIGHLALFLEAIPG